MRRIWWMFAILPGIVVAHQLGISEALLWEKLPQKLGVLQVKDVEVAGNQLRLRRAL